MLEQLYDAVFLKPSKNEVVYNTGSIVTKALIRFALVMIAGFALWNVWDAEKTALVSMLALWGYVFYPAHREWNQFQSNVSIIEEQHLCGSCRHFNNTSQMCSVLDEHVTESFVPCEAMSWEPK